MEHNKMAYCKKADEAWKKDHTVMVSMRLQKNTDADILAALEGKAKQTEIKRLLRIALEVENAKEAAHD